MDAIRATSDLHLTQRSAEYVFRALEALREDAEKRGGHTVLVGDIFDQPNQMHMPTFNRLRDFLMSFKGKVWIVVGNHDQYEGQRNALEALESKDVHVISQPTLTPIGLMMPYLHPSEFWKATKCVTNSIGKPAHKDVWWTHQGWKGSYLNNMVRDRDGLSPRDCPADLVITGHYHAPQNVGPIIYCGSPYQTTFAEEGQEKGWLRWDGDRLPKRIPYDIGAPRHFTVYWNPESGPPIVPDGIKEGDKVRVMTPATRKEAKSAAKQLKAVGLEGAAIVAQPEASSVLTRSVLSEKPVEAAREFIDAEHGPQALSLNPVELHEWAEATGLWD